MKANESLKILSVAMFDLRIRHPDKRPTLHPPTITKLTVLGARRGELFIESSDCQVAVTAERHVVAREKVGVRRVTVEVAVNHFDDQLARLGKKILLQTVEG